MLVSYHQLPPESRVWIYTADRILTEEEVQLAKNTVQRFVMDWQSHGDPVNGWGDVLHKSVIVLMADETMHGPSGCSIDSSVAMLRTIEKALNIQLFNRMIACVFQDEQPQLLTLSALANAYSHNEVDDNTKIVNSMAHNKANYESDFIQPLGKSFWMKLVNRQMSLNQAKV